MEPERKIEKWLRAFARKRREQSGAPMELHPATRRLLQGEVARRAPKPGGGGFFMTLRRLLRPAWAYGLGAAAVVIVVASLVLTERKSRQIALGTDRSAGQFDEIAAPGRDSTEPPAAAPLKSATPVVQSPARGGFETGAGGDQKGLIDLAKKDAATAPEQPSRQRMSDKLQANAPVAGSETIRTTAAELSLDTSRTVAQSADGAVLSRAPATGSISIATARPAEESSRFDQTPATVNIATFGGRSGGVAGDATASTRLEAEQKQVQFYRMKEESATSGPAVSAQRSVAPTAAEMRTSVAATNAVLASFAVEQNGRDLRIVDSDGSVYSGYLQAQTTPAGQSLADAQAGKATDAFGKAQEAGDKDALAAAGNYLFRVSGTNRSLRQNVVFTGNVVPLTGGAQFEPTVGANVAGWNQIPTAPGVVPQLPLTNLRISGTALIDNNRRLEINAAPIESRNR